ncbi:TPA: RelA/SpoT domain-containing protein [Bacillus cereus]|nr:RelA/SpoT domain-containing protein [Bacillus cereus]
MDIQRGLQKFREDYKENKGIFEDFGNSVEDILKKLLNKHSFQYQIVSSRVKTLQSIEKKIGSGGLSASIENLINMDDVIGCRVIFYLESDIERFINLIYEEFSVEKNNLRYSVDDYNALHLVIKLNPEKLEVTEYKKFINLKCEIQLTTVLYHAWSEMAHNIIYKIPEELSEFDERSFDILKNEFGEVMKEYIKPANYSFESINERFENLKQGKKIFDLDFLQSIITARSRNEIYEKMNIFYKFLIEFGDKTPNRFNLIKFLPNVIKISKNLNVDYINTPLGGMYSFEHHHIVKVCLDILSLIGYSDIEATLVILMELAEDEERKIREQSIEILEKLSKFNLKVIEQIGYFPQLRVIEKIEELPMETKMKLWNFFEKAFLNLVNLEFNDYSLVEYNQVSVKSGVIGFNSQLVNVRKKVIKNSIEIYIRSDKPEVKLGVLNVLMELTKLPRRGNFSIDIEDMVLSDIHEIVEWVFEQHENFNLIENKVLVENLSRIIKESPKLQNIKKVEDLELMIKNNPNNEIFKVLVGYDYSYGDGIGWSELRERRRNEIEKFIEDISSDNWESWEKRIISIISCYSLMEYGEFLEFREFLFKLGQAKTNFAKELISKSEEKLEGFLSNLVAGVMSSTTDGGFGEQKILEWLNEKKYVQECAGVYALVKTINIDMLKLIFESAKENKNIDALSDLIRIIVYNKELYEQTSTFLVQIIRELSNQKQFFWTHYMWFDKDSILSFLKESDFDIILSCLEKCNSIGVHEENLLKPLCNDYPEKVINFFENRINIKIEKQKQEKNRLIDTYDAIPHNFYDLHRFLKEKSGEILPLIMEWFNKPEWLFQWEAPALIKIIFPEFDKTLQDYLSELIINGNEEDAKRIIQIIKEYNGSPNTYEICKQLIKKHCEDKELMKGLMSVLAQTGVVMGEYGFVEAYNVIKKEIKKWQKQKPKSQEITKFVGSFVRYINAIITQERKRADKNKEMMVRRFSGK